MRNDEQPRGRREAVPRRVRARSNDPDESPPEAVPSPPGDGAPTGISAEERETATATHRHRDDQLVDLREPEVDVAAAEREAGVASALRAVRRGRTSAAAATKRTPAVDAVARELAEHLVELLVPARPSDLPDTSPTSRSPESLLGALIAAADAGVSVPADARELDDRADAWGDFLDAVIRIGGPGQYVGTFRRGVARAAEDASGLSAVDRLVAAQLLVDRTAREPRLWQDFVVGINAARAVHADIGAPASVIPLVLRHCVWYVAEPPSISAATHGLRFALHVLGTDGGPYLRPWEEQTLRAAASSVRPEHRDLLLTMTNRLHRRDAAVVRLALDAPRRRRFLGRG